MDIKFLMKQAQKIQADITKAQNELALKEYEGTAGGGAVSIKMTGDFHVTSIKIAEDLQKEDITDLEAMLVSTINSTLEAVEKDRNEIMGPITGGAKFPGAF